MQWLTLLCCFLLLPLMLAAQEAEAPVADPAVAPTPEEVELVLDRRDYSPAEIKLLQELEQRRIELSRREKAIDLREELVDLAEERLDEKINTLEALQTSLEGLLKNLSDKEENELEQLARIYTAMKPGAAASVLDRLDNAIVYDLFRRMKSGVTAKIMEKMQPGKARLISEMLAERNDLPAFPGTE